MMAVTLAMIELLTSFPEEMGLIHNQTRGSIAGLKNVFPFGLKASLVWQFMMKFEPWAILHTVVSSPSLFPFNSRFFNPFLLLAFSKLHLWSFSSQLTFGFFSQTFHLLVAPPLCLFAPLHLSLPLLTSSNPQLPISAPKHPSLTKLSPHSHSPTDVLPCD